MSSFDIMCGDVRECLQKIPDQYIQTIVTSPPYWGLRDYAILSQIGRETTADAYISALVEVFAELWRVLDDTGTLWLNLGDTYVAKSLVGIPWQTALALRTFGWYLRADIIWHKPNPMPESITDRPTRAHEYIFLLTKQARYYYNAAAIAEPATVGCRDTDFRPLSAKDRADHTKQRTAATGASLNGRTGKRIDTRNKRSVWSVAFQPFKGAHFAAFPEKLIEPCILAGSHPGDVVLDPFCGSGRTGIVSVRHGRDFIGIDLNPEYCSMAQEAIEKIHAAR